MYGLANCIGRLAVTVMVPNGAGEYMASVPTTSALIRTVSICAVVKTGGSRTGQVSRRAGGTATPSPLLLPPVGSFPTGIRTRATRISRCRRPPGRHCVTHHSSSNVLPYSSKRRTRTRTHTHHPSPTDRPTDRPTARPTDRPPARH